MKKILIVILLSIVANMAFAQVQVALGLKAGANISKFDNAAYNNITSFHGGAFALFKLTKIGIQPEILLSQQGSKFDDDSFGSLDLKASYLTIPVMIKLYLVAGLNLQAGPQFGFLTKAELNGQDIKDTFKSSDISANIGLGWDLPFGLTLDARYNLGLSDVNNGISAESLKSRVVQISVGYKILKFGK